jgi:hypothetical protein
VLNFLPNYTILVDLRTGEENYARAIAGRAIASYLYITFLAPEPIPLYSPHGISHQKGEEKLFFAVFLSASALKNTAFFLFPALGRGQGWGKIPVL